jgi:hypothetical protein
MSGTSSAKTRFALLPGHDEEMAGFAGAQQPVLEAIKRFVSTLPRDRRPTQ